MGTKRVGEDEKREIFATETGDKEKNRIRQRIRTLENGAENFNAEIRRGIDFVLFTRVRHRVEF